MAAARHRFRPAPFGRDGRKTPQGIEAGAAAPCAAEHAALAAVQDFLSLGNDKEGQRKQQPESGMRQRQRRRARSRRKTWHFPRFVKTPLFGGLLHYRYPPLAPWNIRRFSSNTCAARRHAALRMH